MSIMDLQAIEAKHGTFGGGDEDSSLSVVLCGDSSLSVTDCN